MGSPKSLFKIDLPSDWEDQTIYTYMGPEDSGTYHVMTLNIDHHVQAVSLSEYAREQIDAVLNSLQGAEVLKDEEITLENGNQAHEFIYRWIPTDDNVIFKKMVFMLLDDVGYIFTANFTKKTMKTIRHEVDQIINSFEPVTEE